MSSPNEYIEKYKQYDIEQLRSLITDGASVESLELAVRPWRVTRETLESVNDGTRRAVERLKAGWQSESADEFERRVSLIYEFTNDLSIYFDYIEKEILPQLARELKTAQDSAAEISGETSGQSYEEWAENRESHEMDDRRHFEHAQEQERDRMAQIVGTLAHHYDRMREFFENNPPPTPASPEMPGAHAEAPAGMIPGHPGSGIGAPGSQTPTSPNAGSSNLPPGPGGVVGDSDAPPLPATENPWGLGDDDDEQVGDGLYASTNGAGLGGGAPAAAAAPAGGGAGAGAMGAGATGMGVAGGTAAAASSGSGAARAGGGMRPGATGPAGAQAAAGGGKPGASAIKGGAAGRAGGVGQGMAGGRPGEDSDEEESKDANWLTETEGYFAHFDPKAGPADENDPQCVREWERMYDRWLEMKKSGEL